jgi:cytochrome b pre-mRNA-processing protein 3
MPLHQSPARTSRTLTTTRAHYAQVSEPNAKPATSIPPITPHRAPNDPHASQTPTSTKLASELRRVTGRATETYTVYGVTETLSKECAKQADYSILQATDPDAETPKTPDGEDLGVGSAWWHTELGLKPTFSTWSQVTMLHMYVLTARIRCFGEAASPQTYLQHLLDHFFYDAENRMTVYHNLHTRGTRNRYLKDLFIQWRGLLAAYDEGLVKGDAVLAAAVWRNVFKGDEEVDVRKVAMVVSYLRRTLKGLEGVPDEVVQTGDVVFGDPGREKVVVGVKSPLMGLPFKDGKVVNEPVAS